MTDGNPRPTKRPRRAATRSKNQDDSHGGRSNAASQKPAYVPKSKSGRDVRFEYTRKRIHEEKSPWEEVAWGCDDAFSELLRQWRANIMSIHDMNSEKFAVNVETTERQVDDDKTEIVYRIKKPANPGEPLRYLGHVRYRGGIDGNGSVDIVTRDLTMEFLEVTDPESASSICTRQTDRIQRSIGNPKLEKAILSLMDDNQDHLRRVRVMTGHYEWHFKFDSKPADSFWARQREVDAAECEWMNERIRDLETTTGAPSSEARPWQDTLVAFGEPPDPGRRDKIYDSCGRTEQNSWARVREQDFRNWTRRALFLFSHSFVSPIRRAKSFRDCNWCWTENGDLILDDRFAGRLYHNGLQLCRWELAATAPNDHGLRYAYNFRNDPEQMESDCLVVCPQVEAKTIAAIWAGVVKSFRWTAGRVLSQLLRTSVPPYRDALNIVNYLDDTTAFALHRYLTSTKAVDGRPFWCISASDNDNQRVRPFVATRKRLGFKVKVLPDGYWSLMQRYKLLRTPEEEMQRILDKALTDPAPQAAENELLRTPEEEVQSIPNILDKDLDDPVPHATENKLLCTSEEGIQSIPNMPDKDLDVPMPHAAENEPLRTPEEEVQSIPNILDKDLDDPVPHAAENKLLRAREEEEIQSIPNLPDKDLDDSVPHAAENEPLRTTEEEMQRIPDMDLDDPTPHASTVSPVAQAALCHKEPGRLPSPSPAASSRTPPKQTFSDFSTLPQTGISVQGLIESSAGPLPDSSEDGQSRYAAASTEPPTELLAQTMTEPDNILLQRIQQLEGELNSEKQRCSALQTELNEKTMTDISAHRSRADESQGQVITDLTKHVSTNASHLQTASRTAMGLVGAGDAVLDESPEERVVPVPNAFFSKEVVRLVQACLKSCPEPINTYTCLPIEGGTGVVVAGFCRFDHDLRVLKIHKDWLSVDRMRQDLGDPEDTTEMDLLCDTVLTLWEDLLKSESANSFDKRDSRAAWARCRSAIRRRLLDYRQVYHQFLTPDILHDRGELFVIITNLANSGWAREDDDIHLSVHCQSCPWAQQLYTTWERDPQDSHLADITATKDPDRQRKMIVETRCGPGRFCHGVTMTGASSVPACAIKFEGLDTQDRYFVVAMNLSRPDSLLVVLDSLHYPQAEGADKNRTAMVAWCRVAQSLLNAYIETGYVLQSLFRDRRRHDAPPPEHGSRPPAVTVVLSPVLQEVNEQTLAKDVDERIASTPPDKTEAGVPETITIAPQDRKISGKCEASVCDI
ncbi:hypothetical protein BR93DRAFT_547516 [Coniochaeta sp. PMI_546]|nr:hypothetical protein BR93DRAFT_547516 [Coniochaeta sp. PMI_546]